MRDEAMKVLEKLGRAFDLGMDLRDVDLTTVEVYDALVWALDEVYDLRSEVELSRLAAAEAYVEFMDTTEEYDPIGIGEFVSQ